MKAKIDISLYPLNDDFIRIIKHFIAQLHTHEGIVVETNQLSTQIFGDYDQIMALLTGELKTIFIEYKAVAVLKIFGVNEG
jgi:uncharacterized protein YqgV (UPF0045/DUF77 family)